MDLIIKPTELCNFKCSFCSSTQLTEDKASQLDLNYIYRFLERYPETNTIIINGGDPLMMAPEYYWSILDYLDSNNLKSDISFTTNLWPFYKKPKKWVSIFKHPRVGVSTSFQYGGGRLKGDYTVFSEKDFWNVSNMMLDKVGYRPSFIAVITEENEDTVIKTVELAKEMNVVCKVNYAVASGDQARPYMLAKIYEKYIEIWKRGLSDWEHNTQQMMKRLTGNHTQCPQSRDCDSNIRTLQPEGDYYSCGAFGDDREKSIDFEFEMNGGKSFPLRDSFELNVMKQSCYTCPMFSICNGCKKTIKDQKRHNMVEDHCKLMKSLALDIIKSNKLNLEVTPYVNEADHIIAKS